MRNGTPFFTALSAEKERDGEKRKTGKSGQAAFTLSNSFVISRDGAFVSRLTTTIKMQETTKAGSNS